MPFAAIRAAALFVLAALHIYGLLNFWQVCILPFMQPSSAVSAQSINSLYVLKAICALFVVMIHSSMFGKEYLCNIIYIAVPCFFCISGYFLYSGSAREECRRAVRWIRKILALYLVLAPLYAVFFHLTEDATYTWRDAIISLIAGTTPAFHLWYMVSFMQALLLFILLRRFRLFGVSALVLAFGVHYAFKTCLDHKIFFKTWLVFSAPFYAFVLIGIGYYSAKWKSSRLSACIPLLIILASFVCKYAADDASEDILRLVKLICDAAIAASCLALCLRFPDASIPAVSRIGKYHSANIYYYHVFVYKLMMAGGITLCGVNVGEKLPWITFVLTLLLSMMMAYAIGLWKHRKKAAA